MSGTNSKVLLTPSCAVLQGRRAMLASAAPPTLPPARQLMNHHDHALVGLLTAASIALQGRRAMMASAAPRIPPASPDICTTAPACSRHPATPLLRTPSSARKSWTRPPRPVQTCLSSAPIMASEGAAVRCGDALGVACPAQFSLCSQGPAAKNRLDALQISGWQAVRLVSMGLLACELLYV